MRGSSPAVATAPATGLPRYSTPVVDRIVIAVLMGIAIASGFFGAAGYDTVRDVAHAEAIHRLVAFPLHGPELAPGQVNGLHLGPVWFYLLALPLWFHSSWVAIAVFVAALTSLQFPLAYATGRRLGGRRFGLLWCVLLALPGWSSFDLVGFAHTNAVRVAVMLTLYALVRLALERRPRWLVLAAFALALAVHAHPTALAYALLVAVVGFVALPDAGARMRWGLAALLAAALPFAPLGIEALTAPSSVARDAGAYVSGAVHPANLLQVPALLYGVLVRGPWVVANAFCNWTTEAATFVAGATWLVEAAAAVGLVVALGKMQGRVPAAPQSMPEAAPGGASRAMPKVALDRVSPTRRLALVAIAVTVLVTLVIALLRPVTPFYMTYALLPALAAAGAIGLDALAAVLGRWVTGTVIGVVLALHAASALGIMAAIESGHVRVPVATRLDVKAEAAAPSSPEIWLPAYAVDRSGALLCGSVPAVLHGSYAFLADVYGGLDQQLICQRHDAQLTGAAPTGALHWVGLAMPLWRALGGQPQLRLGGLGLAPATRVLWPPEGMPIRDARVYPPRTPRAGPSRQVVIEAELRVSEALVVSAPLGMWMAPPRIEVSIDGTPAMPLAQDAVSAVYRCGRCEASAVARWTISVDSAAPEWIDVVTTSAPAESAASVEAAQGYSMNVSRNPR